MNLPRHLYYRRPFASYDGGYFARTFNMEYAEAANKCVRLTAKKPTVVLGQKAVSCRYVMIERPTARKLELNALIDLAVPQKSVAIVNKMYGLPDVGGMPLSYISMRNNGTPMSTFLTTSAIARVDGFKQVDVTDCKAVSNDDQLMQTPHQLDDIIDIFGEARQKSKTK